MSPAHARVRSQISCAWARDDLPHRTSSTIQIWRLLYDGATSGGIGARRSCSAQRRTAGQKASRSEVRHRCGLEGVLQVDLHDALAVGSGLVVQESVGSAVRQPWIAATGAVGLNGLGLVVGVIVLV